MLCASKFLRPSWKPSVNSVKFAYNKAFFDMLNLNPEPNYTQMANGLTVASEERPGVEHVCIGLFIDGGSRYESKYDNGIAHFFEHMAFKSTCCRPAPVLQKTMASLGARFKCFTTRELVGYYAECLSEDICLVVDILADCVFSNELNDQQIEYQKSVVLREMMEKDTDANDVLWDYLHAAAFMGTPLGRSVMGPSNNLNFFCERTIRNYLKQFFDPTRTVLAAVGGVCHEQLVDLAQCYLLKLEPAKCTDDVYRFTTGDIRFREDTYPYCNTVIAFEAPCLCDTTSWAMEVAAAHIGGWERRQPGGRHSAHHVAQASSFGNQAYAYRSFYIKYKDTGLWGVQMLANSLEQDCLFYNLQSELMNLCSTITKNEVDRAKHATKTRLMTQLEGVTASCIDLGRWTLYNGRRPSLVEKLTEIDRVRPADIHHYCDYFLYDRSPAVAAVGPTENVPAHIRISHGQNWLRL